MTVAFDRSSVSTPAGALPPAVTEVILSPSITISAFATGVSPLPSISFPARIAILLGAAPLSFVCPTSADPAAVQSANPATKVTTSPNTFRHLFIVAPRRLQRVAQPHLGGAHTAFVYAGA